MLEESSWHGRLSQPVFLKHLNKTHQGIICEIEIKIAYIKKHVYKDRKEITHVEIGEEKTYTIIYMKIKYNVCQKNSHKTSIQEAVTKKKEKFM